MEGDVEQYSLEFAAGQYLLAGRRVAELHGDVLSKRVRGSVHMLHHPRRAWAIDQGVLVDGEQRGARLVEILDQDDGTFYRAAIALFHQRGFTVSRGYGEQRALALEFWTVGNAARPPAAVPVQLAFGW
jgi:hypothetical protein